MRFPLVATSAVMAFCLSIAVVTSASATAISGSDTIGAGVTSTNESGGNLGSSTTILLSSPDLTFSVFAKGAGDFSVVPIGTIVTLGSTTLNLASAATFGFNDPGVGDFVPSTITVYDETPTTIAVFLTGTFTPGSLFPVGSTAPLGASETLSLTQTNGGEISLSGTFASPPSSNPVPVPEPLTLSLFGAALAGAVALRRRKRL